MVVANERIKGLEEHQAFLDSFYKPNFSAYDFLCLYCAKLVKRQIFHFRIEELENFLEECKKQGKYITIDRNYPVEKMCDPRKKYEEEMNLFVEEYLTHLKNENMELKMRYLN